MGIHGLTKFLQEKAPNAVHKVEAKSFMGRVLALDISLALYQFMVAIRDSESYGNFTNEAGESTSHIMGMLNRITRLMELGIKPIAVFDGAPPVLKTGELAKRKDRKLMAEESLEDAKERGDMEEMKKFAGRSVKITRTHNDQIKRLLSLMGIPIIEAPCEAEAQCAELCKQGIAYGTATEDADALCFGTPILIRHLTFSDSSNSLPVLEIRLKEVLESLEMDMSAFINFCILCGCDYCDTIKGVGPSTAFKLIKQYNAIESVLENLPGKIEAPKKFPYEAAREFFIKPQVLQASDVPPLQWKDLDQEGLIKFLVQENGFNETRVNSVIARLRKSRNLSQQARLENFFGPTQVKRSSIPVKKSIVKTQTKKKIGRASSSSAK